MDTLYAKLAETASEQDTKLPVPYIAIAAKGGADNDEEDRTPAWYPRWEGEAATMSRSVKRAKSDRSHLAAPSF